VLRFGPRFGARHVAGGRRRHIRVFIVSGPGWIAAMIRDRGTRRGGRIIAITKDYCYY
jgi:hypothetical protein